jgi:hypothetical protein
MYPIDGSSPYYRFEQLEIDMHMSLYDLGPSEQVTYFLFEFFSLLFDFNIFDSTWKN